MAIAVHAALGDRIQTWAMVSSPWTTAWLGYGNGTVPPGTRDRSRAARAAHQLLLAHGRAVAAMRAQAPVDHQFGLTLDLCGIHPCPELDPELLPYSARSLRIMDGLRNRWWLGAIVGDGYPEDVVVSLAADLDGVVLGGDWDEIGAPLDCLGVDYRHDEVVPDGDEPVEDPLRVDCLWTHVAAVVRAVAAGATSVGTSSGPCWTAWTALPNTPASSDWSGWTVGPRIGFRAAALRHIGSSSRRAGGEAISRA